MALLKFFKYLHCIWFRHQCAICNKESITGINSSTPSAAYMCQWIGSALVQIMACRLFGAKPLSKSMLVYCQLEPKEQISVKFQSKCKTFHSWKCVRNCRLRNDALFVQGEMCFKVQYNKNICTLFTNGWSCRGSSIFSFIYVIYSLAPHDDAIKCNHFPLYWPFVRGIHRSSVNSPHKGQWRGALMFSLICAW